MNKLIVTGFALSGITIAILTVEVVSRTNHLKRLIKTAQQLKTFNDLTSRIILAQYDRPDEAGILIPEKLEADLDAFTIFMQNDI